jgi:hypothetical protein
MQMKSNNHEVSIKIVTLNSLSWYQVYVRGVLACEAMSEAGARSCAYNYIRKLGRG